MLAVGSISNAAIQLREALLEGINDFDNDAELITIGSPSSNLSGLKDVVANKTKSGLNLFIYHVAYDGYPSDGTADSPFYVKVYCLITAVGYKSSPSEGENELRLIGEVMRVFHQNPIIPVGTGKGQSFETVATLQIIPHELTLDSLNHIWSTQGSDTPYRLSVAYEMALAPVPLSQPQDSTPRFGDLRSAVWGDMERARNHELDGINSRQPQVGRIEIDAEDDRWAPHVCMVWHPGEADESLGYISTAEDPANELDMAAAGAAGETIEFSWSIWRRRVDNTTEAWQPIEAGVGTAEITIADAVEGSFWPNIFDPVRIDARQRFKLHLPPDIVHIDTLSWQVMAVVGREAIYEDPARPGRTRTETIQGNTLLFHGSQDSEISAQIIDTSQPEWAPVIAIVDESRIPAGELRRVFEVPSDDLANQLKILVAGKAGEEMGFFWSIRTRDASGNFGAWQAPVADTASAPLFLNDTDPGEPFVPNRIDPDAIDPRRVFSVKLPASLNATEVKTWQAKLYIERKEGTGASSILIQSKPVLFYGVKR